MFNCILWESLKSSINEKLSKKAVKLTVKIFRFLSCFNLKINVLHSVVQSKTIGCDHKHLNMFDVYSSPDLITLSLQLMMMSWQLTLQTLWVLFKVISHISHTKNNCLTCSQCLHLHISAQVLLNASYKAPRFSSELVDRRTKHWTKIKDSKDL